MKQRFIHALSVGNNLAGIVSAAGITYTVMAYRKQVANDSADSRQRVWVSSARSYWNDRLASNFFTVHGGSASQDKSHRWDHIIKAALHLMKEKLENEAMQRDFLKGEKIDVDALRGAPSTVMLSLFYEMWRVHYTTAMDVRSSETLVQEWWGEPQDCRLGEFWTGIALMNIAERSALGTRDADQAADVLVGHYYKVTEKVGHSGKCAGSIMSPEQMKDTVERFRAEAVKLRPDRERR